MTHRMCAICGQLFYSTPSSSLNFKDLIFIMITRTLPILFNHFKIIVQRSIPIKPFLPLSGNLIIIASQLYNLGGPALSKVGTRLVIKFSDLVWLFCVESGVNFLL